jgi:hypothetical protein
MAYVVHLLEGLPRMNAPAPTLIPPKTALADLKQDAKAYAETPLLAFAAAVQSDTDPVEATAALVNLHAQLALGLPTLGKEARKELAGLFAYEVSKLFGHVTPATRPG